MVRSPIERHFDWGPLLEQRKLGECFAAETGFIVGRDPDTVRAPDYAFIPKERIPEGGITKKFLTTVPSVVIEILSPGDAAVDVEEKIGEWLEFGVDEVWVVNPKRRTVTVHAQGRDAHVVRSGEVLEGTGALAGFSLRVAELFPG
jgi:Uma2 family endonuclease